jgi:hypothetical protein
MGPLNYQVFVVLLFLLTGVVVAGVWIAAVVYVFVDATSRRMRSAIWWAMGVLLLGPFAFIAYLIDRPRAAQTPCPFCKQTILATDAQCPYCGRDVV